MFNSLTLSGGLSWPGSFTFRAIKRSGLGLLSGVIVAFSGQVAWCQNSPPNTWVDNPGAAFAAGTSAYYQGDVATALEALEFAAEGGHAIARWKLAKMYADGDGVNEDHLRAFQYFSEIASAHAEDRPDTPHARFVANAFVALGAYYSSGIGGALAADPFRSRQIYTYAASYFGDPDAQYRLGVMTLHGEGGGASSRQAGRWLSLAARKGHMDAQIALGELLFSGGEHIQPHRADGLKWLIIAGEFATHPHQYDRVRPIQERYLALANPDVRARALQMAEEWLTGPEGASVLRMHRSETEQR